MKCKKVFATDLEEILKNTNQNLEENNIKNVITRKLEWGHIEDLEKFKDEKINLLIMSDCIYEEAPMDKLLETILYFAKLNSDIELILLSKKRYKLVDDFIQNLEMYFDIEKINKKLIYHEFQNMADTYVFIKCKYKI